MDWTEQMQELTRSWTGLQRSMVSQWAEAAQRFAPASQRPTGEWARQWQEAVTQSLGQWLGQGQSLQDSTAQRILDSGKIYQRFFESFDEAMKTVAPGLSQGTQWATALAKYFEQIQTQMVATPQLWMKPESAAALGDEMKELWELFLGEIKGMTVPWVQSLDTTRGHLGEAMAGDHRAMIRMFNLFTDTYESTLGKFLTAPAIGYTREYQEKLTKAFDS